MKKLSLPLKRVRREAWISVFSVVFLISLWEAAVDLRWVNSTFFPSPSTIARATVDSIASGELTSHVSITMARMFAGFFAGAASGLVIGLAMGWSKEVRAFLDPIVSVIYPLPKIALLPLNANLLIKARAAAAVSQYNAMENTVVDNAPRNQFEKLLAAMKSTF